MSAGLMGDARNRMVTASPVGGEMEWVWRRSVFGFAVGGEDERFGLFVAVRADRAALGGGDGGGDGGAEGGEERSRGCHCYCYRYVEEEERASRSFVQC